MGPDQHVVEVHADDDLVQAPCGVDAEPAFGFGAMTFRRIIAWHSGIQCGDQPDSGFEQALIQRLLQ